MAEDSDNAQRPAPKRPRGRRRRRSAFALLVAGALWLLGYGAGWFGSAVDPDGGTDGQRPGAAPSQVVADGPGLRDNGARTGAEEGGEPVLASAPGGETDAEATASKAAEVSKDAVRRAELAKPVEGMEPDRFASLMSLFRAHLDAGDIARAAELIQRLRSQVGKHEQQGLAVQRCADEIAQKRSAAESAILRQLRQGEVLAADLAAEQLAGRAEWAPGSALGAVADLGSDWTQAAVLDALPQAAPLPRKRRVRLQWQDGWQEGAVAGSRPQRTTVHLRSATGQSYPTVATIAVEPVQSTQKEAIEMGLAAAHAAAPRLARMWLVRAMLLSDELGPRGAQLRDALSGR